MQPVGFGEVARLVPYLYCAVIALASLTLTVAVVRRGPLFRIDRGILLAGIAIVGMFMSGIGYGQLSVTAAAAVIVFAFWAFQRFLNPARPWSPNVFTGLMILFLTYTLLSTIGAQTSAFLTLSSLIVKAIVPILLVDAVRSMRQVRVSVEVLIWATVASAFLALLQVAASALYGFNYSLVDDRYNMLVNAPWGGGRIVQASAFTRENNSLACMLATVSLVALAQMFTSKDGRRRALLGAAVLLMWLMAFLSTVRGSWVATFVGVLLLPYMVWPRRWAQWTGAVLLVATLALSSGAVTATLTMMNSLRQDAMSGRLELMKPGIENALTYPLNGRSMGQASRTSTFNQWGPHNTPVAIAANFGIPAAVIFLCIVAWIGVRLVWAAGWAATPMARAQCLALLAGFVPLLTVMQSEPMSDGQFLWVFLGLCEAGACAAIAAR